MLRPAAALAVALAASLAPTANAQSCAAPASDAACGANMRVDCFTAASGVCSPTSLRTDDFCDARLNCGAPDPKCNFQAPTARHLNSNHNGGLLVRRRQRLARALACAPVRPPLSC